jgi:uncharacterized protein with ParB-like and HNH nuclease domain
MEKEQNMSNGIQNKIEAGETNLFALLKGNKFVIDYFQREYRWQKKHIEQLVDDLTTTFLKAYKDGDERNATATYPTYYLGSAVFFTNAESKTSIIDGQQRITSITLFLIFLNHLQKKLESDEVEIKDMVYAKMRGEKSFVLSDDDRKECLEALLGRGAYEPNKSDSETVHNMVERYNDICEFFPEEKINATVLPYFIDWLILNVIIAKVTAYSEENAYTIFETMNDRGLTLTQSEMLKSFVVSRVTDKEKREKIDDVWKEQIQALHKISEKADLSFFQAWFRSKYASTVRTGEDDKDFELIASQFHKWFKDNSKKVFHLETATQYYNYFCEDFPFFAKWYMTITSAFLEFNPELPHLYYLGNLGFAESLREPFVLAAVKKLDEQNEKDIFKKIDVAASFLEIFAIRRIVNNKRFGQSTIKKTIFRIITVIRDKSLSDLIVNLNNEQSQLATEFSWNGAKKFILNEQNRKYIKHLLCRVSSYIDKLSGDGASTYKNYYSPDDSSKPYEIEHLWANNYTYHKDECKTQDDFKWYRNLIGALILLQRGPNQSFGDLPYEDKLEHYIKCPLNAYGKTLCSKFYLHNPNFLNSDKLMALGFKAHPKMKIEDVEARTQLVVKICESLWADVEEK